MTEFKVILPKLGESIQEATITKWFVREGDKVKEDDLLLEVATDKVDSEIPSPVEGVIKKILFRENSLLPVGTTIALIEISGLDEGHIITENVQSEIHETLPESSESGYNLSVNRLNSSDSAQPATRFYSPLVKKIAAEEQVSMPELSSIPGSGAGGRVQKKDILKYIESRDKSFNEQKKGDSRNESTVKPQPETGRIKFPVSIGAEDQIIEMDRIRKLIAGHMVSSKQISPHVTTVVEADVTNLVLWRAKVKEIFQTRYGEKLTYMPLFIEAVTRALSEFPMVNASVDDDRIILKKHINIGFAVAKPDGNLIVPVIKKSEEMNLPGLARQMNRLADAARTNKLLPEEIQEGTFTITNFGSFRNLIGTPIINQPQVAILATGSIEKKPAVLELPSGDVIAIRHKMFLSLSYDHRIIDGALGGAFLRRIADLLEDFDINRTI